MAEWTQADAYGLDTLTLPEGYMPLEIVCAVKCLDQHGNSVMVHRFSRTASVSDCLGMAVGLVVMLEDELKGLFTPVQDIPDVEDPDA